jgi:hypothetical protein|tara:strand:+ start:677 stop:877 length:201 start_codon:yes stop_codon:yes gene_type:complete
MANEIKKIAINISTHYKLGLYEEARHLFYDSGFDGITMIQVWDLLDKGTRDKIKDLQVNTINGLGS